MQVSHLARMYEPHVTGILNQPVLTEDQAFDAMKAFIRRYHVCSGESSFGLSVLLAGLESDPEVRRDWDAQIVGKL